MTSQSKSKSRQSPSGPKTSSLSNTRRRERPSTLANWDDDFNATFQRASSLLTATQLNSIRKIHKKAQKEGLKAFQLQPKSILDTELRRSGGGEDMYGNGNYQQRQQLPYLRSEAPSQTARGFRGSAAKSKHAKKRLISSELRPEVISVK